MRSTLRERCSKSAEASVLDRSSRAGESFSLRAKVDEGTEHTAGQQTGTTVKIAPSYEYPYADMLIHW